MLAFENVTRLFRGGGGVSDLTFTVGAGEIVALIGLNGVGKTTLMRLALGMLRPQQGFVRVLGHALEQRRTPTIVPAAVWAQVGALIEMPLVYPELTARRNLYIAALLHGADPDGTVPRSIAEWQLGPVADRRFRRLSLGNRQRVGLAAALQHDPRVIVLDEPGNALDPASVLLLREQLIRRAREDAAILVSSHHLDEVSRIADRVLLMNGGRLIGELDTTGSDLERAFFERVREDDARREAAEVGR
ncbi:ABC transporter ATP-binding protein [Microbacterium sp. YJN-G]|uniref:ABC transporter ATP-binding protein n=1 Tax=Microbacterium sp. YJN-G TaxID=2763257 RepID=UPI001878B9D0|nr:ABC transporter ATP-binding protein [Microbacterium sp. YJN-G]